MNINNQLTPAGFRFLGGLYEQAVDKGLNVAEIQDYLRMKGINKPLITIKYELDELFCFHGYAAAHPAPPALTLGQIDAQLAKPARKVGSLTC